MIYMLFNRHCNSKIPAAIFFFCLLFLISCSSEVKKISLQSPVIHTAQSATSLQWYRQAVVDLGSRIIMFSPNKGIAISNGRGEINGKLYYFKNGEWKSIYEFEYSDYPLIATKDSSVIWSVNHLTHNGAYKPVHSEFVHGKRKEIPLPKIMWDAVDYVMYKGIHQFADGTAWMVGQQGHILYYNGTQWSEAQSPLVNTQREVVYEGDLNDIVMLSKNSGWAVGRLGVILRYENGKWSKFPSPTENSLNKIEMANEQLGWAVGERGTILRWNGSEWLMEKTDVRERLHSIKVIDSVNVWIVGASSTLLYFNGVEWIKNETIKLYDDTFLDIDVIKDSLGIFHTWIIGGAGIYTNSQSMGFSFTDITTAASLQRSGRAGIFFHYSNNYVPDLFVLEEGGPNLYFENAGNNRFINATAKNNLLDAPQGGVTAFGDVNNDGEIDIFQLVDHEIFKLYLGTMTGSFRDATEFSQLQFSEINPAANNAAKFIDFDNDSDLDLYIANFDLPDQLLLNDGTGRFTNATSSANISKILKHSSYGAAFSDFNGDGFTDIFITYYVSLHGKFFDLFLNNGNATFTRSYDSAFYSPIDYSPTASIANDFNNDGYTDIFVFCQQKYPPILFLNNGKGKFRNVAMDVGLTKPILHPEPVNGTIGAADVNNDGWLDIFASTKLYLNGPDFYFTEVAERTGIQFVGTPTFADIDNDGDEDLFIGSSRNSLGKGDRAALFRNNINNENFVKVKVFADESNRFAFGAKVFLLKGDSVLQMREVGFGSNPLTIQNLTEVHFGAERNDTYNVKVLFPSGVEKIVNNVPNGSVVSVFESSFFLHYAILSVKSLRRTIQLLQWKLDGARFIAALILLVGCMYFGKKFNAQSLVLSWQFIAGFFVFHLLLVHLFINQPPVYSVGGAIVVQAIISIGSIAVARYVIARKNAKYISHYKILELLGAGGMGKVYKALDTNSKQMVALKVLNPELLKDQENRRRLSAEGHLLASFNHPHIVKVFEIGESNERGFIAMELLVNGTLKEKLEREHPLPEREVRKYILQVCDGLSEVHSKGIVHRDLKTGNLMLDASGNIRIMDFGLSKSPLVTTMTSLGTVLGTLGYVAPEQVTSLNVDQRTDIFSLGVIMYELLTNQLPFNGENEIALIHSIFNTVPPIPSSLRDDISKHWDAIVMKCLAKDMDERFASAEEVRNKINTISTFGT